MPTRTRFSLHVVIIAFLPFSGLAAGQFSQQGPKLVGAGGVGASQGYAVAISADGNTAIVGGPDDNGSVGAAWIWTRSGGVWIQQSKVTGSDAVGSARQGASVALSADGNTAIIGGYDDNGFAGAAWIWTRSSGVWIQQSPKLVGTGAVGKASQGGSVSLSANGNTAVVGGSSDNGGIGAVWVWNRSGSVWTQTGTKLVGSGAIGSARQGQSVSLSADGNTAIVGGIRDNGGIGAAWVWTQSGGVWTQAGAKLVGSGSTGNAKEGWSVSLSADGSTAMIGGESDNQDTGAAWVWIRNGGIWTQQGNKLVGLGTTIAVLQGSSVSLSADGNKAIIGAPLDNPPGQVGTGCCQILTTGVARIWTRSGGVWTEQGPAFSGSDGLNSFQGTSVALSADGNTAIVGGPLDGASGAAWVFVSSSLASAIPMLGGMAILSLLTVVAMLALFRLR